MGKAYALRSGRPNGKKVLDGTGTLGHNCNRMPLPAPQNLTLTNLQQAQVALTGKDANNNTVANGGIVYTFVPLGIAGIESISADSLTLHVKGLTPGSCVLHAHASAVGGSPTIDQDLVNITVTQDPSIPGPLDHFDVVVSPPVPQ